MTNEKDRILNERPSVHGELAENSRATWQIMRMLQYERNWPTLTDEQKHSIYMIVHKLARIVVGNPGATDHWDDIAGYATLVADRLRRPVIPYDGDDLFATLARGWNCTVDEARARVQEYRAQRHSGPQDQMQRDLLRSRGNGSHPPEGQASAAPAKVPTPDRNRPSANEPGTPEDGGHHAAASDFEAEIEAAAEQIRKEVERGH